jgi:cell wall-associated NlpC family hydrolase
MTTPISGLAEVQARIAQIQAQVASLTGGRANVPAIGASQAATPFADSLSTAASGGTPTTSAAGGTAGVTGENVLAQAKTYLGVPYVFGGTTRAGLDCSGLLQRAYGDLGIKIPRLSYAQAKIGTAVPSLAQARPGDILVFGADAHHVAMYAGNNMMIAAPEPGENVKLQSVYETPASIRRVLSGSPGAGLLPEAAPSAVQVGSAASGINSDVSRYASLFGQTEARLNLPAGLLAAVAQTESAGNASAVSPAGAQGLMQLMPTTASGLGVDPWDPSQAIRGAGRLLSGYLHKYGSVPLALAAYNAGPGAVDQYNGIPPYQETQNYVRKITGLMRAAA